MDTNEHELITKEGHLDLSETETKRTHQFTVIQKLVALFVGVLLPIIAFWLGVVFRPEWQSKTIESYFSMLLTPYATWPFWPFIFYSMFCLVFVLFKKKVCRSFWIRIGLYMGIIWSLPYIIILAMVLRYNYDKASAVFLYLLYGIAVTLLPILLLMPYSKLSSNIVRLIRCVVFAVILFVLLIAMCLISQQEGGGIFYLLAGTLFASPFWCLAVYLLMSIYACRQCSEVKLALALKYKILIGSSALLAYLGAWWLSIQSMLTEYAKLPTEPPDCYIATAAAKGHRRFVRSEDVVLANGKVMRVNVQLRYLKCGELMIKAVFPKLHRLMRIIYDVIGPLLACCLAWPILADVTYILLKPAEWLVCGVLFVVFGRKWDIAKKFYN